MRAWLCVMLVIAACGSPESPKKKWLGAKWTPVSGDVRGVKFTAEVPEGLPENKDFLLGRDWWVGANTKDLEKWVGPRLSIVTKDRKLDLEELLREESHGTVVEKEARSDRVRVLTTSKGSHLHVTVWVPIDGERVLACEAGWYTGEERMETPDREILAWLDRFCASLHVVK